MRQGFAIKLNQTSHNHNENRLVLTMNLINNPNSHDENKMSIYYELNQPPK